MCSMTILFTTWQCKVYTLAPIYTHDANYFRIDTRALHELPGRTQGIGLSLVQLNARREEFYRIHFNLPCRLFTRVHKNSMLQLYAQYRRSGCKFHIFRWK
jgi:hypothetical protein